MSTNLTSAIKAADYPRIILGGDQFVDYWGPQRDPLLATVDGVFQVMKTAFDQGVRGYDLSMNDHVLTAFRRLQDATSGGVVGIANVNWKLDITSGTNKLWDIRPRIVATVVREYLQGSASKLKKENPGVWQEWFSVADGAEPLDRQEINEWVLDGNAYRERLQRYKGLARFCLVGSDYADWCIALGRKEIVEGMIQCAKDEGFIPISVSHWTSVSLNWLDTLDVAGHWVMTSRDRRLLFSESMLEAVRAARKPITAFQILGHGRLINRMRESFSYIRDVINPYSVVIGICSAEQSLETFGLLKEMYPSLFEISEI